MLTLANAVTDAVKSVKWAAFYSDDEHEVKEVKNGHRVTSTYNLYVHERVGGIMRKHPTTEPDSMVLHHRAKEALASPAFMKTGKLCDPAQKRIAR